MNLAFLLVFAFGFALAVTANTNLSALKFARETGQRFHQTPTNFLRYAAPLPVMQINRQSWKVTCSSAQPGNECEKMIDGDKNTFWHTVFHHGHPPHQVVVDFGGEYPVNSISVFPRQDHSRNGYIAEHEVAVSRDNNNWEVVAVGMWNNDNNLEKFTNFEPVAARYLRIKALNDADGHGLASIAELTAYQSANGPTVYSAQGKWGPTIDFPTIAVAATVEPETGKVRIWSSYKYDSFGDRGDDTSDTTDSVYMSTWNPANNRIEREIIYNTHHDMFCPGISIDGTGQMVVTGGNYPNHDNKADINPQRTSLYNFASRKWTAGPPMNFGRGYQASAALSDGRVFTIGGSWSGVGMNGKGIYKNGEVYDPRANTWTELKGADVKPMLTSNDNEDAPGDIYRGDNHGWLFGWKNGSVFQAGPSTSMNWYGTSGAGSCTSAGRRTTTRRGDDPDSMNGNAVMFDATQGQILTMGGATSYEYNADAKNGRPQLAAATKNAHLITIGAVGAQAKVQVASSGMFLPRSFHTSVVLPDGTVFITGGQGAAKTFSDEWAQLTPEIYNPATDGFYQQQPNSIPRTYHSVSLLLPDGRVFNGGGGLCGGCNANHLDAQIFTPQYLFTKTGAIATRPAITSLEQKGDVLIISTDSHVETASLIRYAATTHTVNTDQRRVPLRLTSAGAYKYTAEIPTDPGILLPGKWMLFVLNKDGVPSMARNWDFLSTH